MALTFFNRVQFIAYTLKLIMLNSFFMPFKLIISSKAFCISAAWDVALEGFYVLLQMRSVALLTMDATSIGIA